MNNQLRYKQRLTEAYTIGYNIGYGNMLYESINFDQVGNSISKYLLNYQTSHANCTAGDILLAGIRYGLDITLKNTLKHKFSRLIDDLFATKAFKFLKTAGLDVFEKIEKVLRQFKLSENLILYENAGLVNLGTALRPMIGLQSISSLIAVLSGYTTVVRVILTVVQLALSATITLFYTRAKTDTEKAYLNYLALNNARNYYQDAIKTLKEIVAIDNIAINDFVSQSISKITTLCNSRRTEVSFNDINRDIETTGDKRRDDLTNSITKHNRIYEKLFTIIKVTMRDSIINYGFLIDYKIKYNNANSIINNITKDLTGKISKNLLPDDLIKYENLIKPDESEMFLSLRYHESAGQIIKQFFNKIMQKYKVATRYLDYI